MRPFAACLLAAGVFPLLVGAGKELPFSLLLIGQYHAHEVPDTAAGEWLGVYESAHGHEVKLARVRINRIYDPIGDEVGAKTSKKTGKEIIATPSKGLVFLVRELAGVRTGPVEAVFSAKSDEERKWIASQKLPLVLAGTRYELAARERSARKGGVVNCELVLTRKSDGSPAVRQSLCMSMGRCDDSESIFIQLVWAGDLDHDSHLDLLVNLGEYNTSAPTLFLSSLAKSGELVAKTAELVSHGC